MKRILLAGFFALACGSVSAGEWIQAGRKMDFGPEFELYGGVGRLDSISGSVEERGPDGAIPGGIRVDFDDLGIQDGNEAFFLGAQFRSRWVSVLLDMRKTNLDGSGLAQQEIRLSVDEVLGQPVDVLVIPEGEDFRVDADATFVGLGLRVTPLTVNPGGRVRFIPWLHLGMQYIRTEYDIDVGGAVNVQVGEFLDRTVAVEGRASSTDSVAIPEYGLGAALNFRLGNLQGRGVEVVTYATWKILDFNGRLSTFGIDASEFERVNIDYSSLEVGANLYIPVGDTFDVFAGLYMEDVRSEVRLESRPEIADFTREASLDYTLVGLRLGLRF